MKTLKVVLAFLLTVSVWACDSSPAAPLPPILEPATIVYKAPGLTVAHAIGIDGFKTLAPRDSADADLILDTPHGREYVAVGGIARRRFDVMTQGQRVTVLYFVRWTVDDVRP